MHIQEVIEKVTKQLRSVPGVKAVVLGGSRAVGTANEHSDIDIGVYYDGEALFDISKLRTALQVLDETSQITEPGEWGPWINGGGWLHIDGIPTDILLRDFRKVNRVLDDCINGTITIDYQCGHPFGFINTIYAAEIASCIILYEIDNVISDLKQNLIPYPPAMKQAVIDKFLWEAEFSFQCGEKSVSKGDFVNAAGSVYRCIVSLLQVLAAQNELFLMNEKGALARVLDCPVIPPELLQLCKTAFAGLSSDSGALSRSFAAVEELIAAVKDLNR